jgi:triacylglycerol lipase
MNSPIHKSYDKATARTLAAGAKAAYGDRDTMRAWAASIGCEMYELIEDRTTQTRVFAAAGDQFAVVCFRGSVDLRNWLTNFDAVRVAMPWDEADLDGVEVHAGFLRALDSIWGEVEAAVARMAARARTVFFAGHSLGGALAMLAAARWAGRGCPVNHEIGHYSFGQPRVGNSAWAAWFNHRLGGHSFRVIHSDDFVPRVPWLLQAYRHAGVEVFYPTFSAQPATFILDCPWWRKFPCDLAGAWQELRQGRLALLADHHIDSYVKLFIQ